MYDVFQTEIFKDQFHKMPNDIQKEADKLIKLISDGSETGKPLKGVLKNFHSVRVKKEYRLVFRFHNFKNRIDLISIGYRKKFYKELERLKREAEQK